MCMSLTMMVEPPKDSLLLQQETVYRVDQIFPGKFCLTRFFRESLLTWATPSTHLGRPAYSLQSVLYSLLCSLLTPADYSLRQLAHSGSSLRPTNVYLKKNPETPGRQSSGSIMTKVMMTLMILILSFFLTPISRPWSSLEASTL